MLTRHRSITLARYVRPWLEQREGLVADLRTDESRPQHLVDLFRQRCVQGAIAPKTVHNIYGVLKALHQDAYLADRVTTSP
ncbi:hypothetical protein [Pyxidicoccus xibeiensis]|uniref:hypothetical protein n=1 Tax=Pyxidicoccus xibeiensis TaxID=2906759 RepID=UPI0020A6EBD3|nr:hypothetical protein [Pyxidicoccus xibeiensis]MCP3138369.1 hypothetical protein [Pyxidicoccus xibeiensis]